MLTISSLWCMSLIGLSSNYLRSGMVVRSLAMESEVCVMLNDSFLAAVFLGAMKTTSYGKKKDPWPVSGSNRDFSPAARLARARLRPSPGAHWPWSCSPAPTVGHNPCVVQSLPAPFSTRRLLLQCMAFCCSNSHVLSFPQQKASELGKTSSLSGSGVNQGSAPGSFLRLLG